MSGDKETMGKRNLPAKFNDEKECGFCGCLFLPDEKSTDNLCAQCVANNYEIPDDGIVKQEQEVLYSKVIKPIMDNRVGLSAFRPKECIKCHNTFTPTAPANKICTKCKRR